MSFIERSNTDDIEILMTIYDADDNVVDLTGATAIEFAMSLNENTDPLIEKSYPSDGISLIGPAQGQYLIRIDSADITGMTGNHYWESRVTLDGEISTVVRGIIKLYETII